MTARKIPGRPGVCAECKEPFVWGRTVAAESGAGGKGIPLNPFEDPAGSYAVRPVNDRGGLVARALKKDETHDTFTELLAMPHKATCAPVLQLPIEDPPPGNVLDFTAAQAARGKAKR